MLGTQVIPSYEELHTIIGSIPVKLDAETIERNLALVGRLGDQEVTTSLLEEILSDPSACAQVAGRSYRHVNHFDKIVLIDSEARSGYRLTLHLWSPPYTDNELNEELIHDHRFSFWSTILTGDLISENFKPSVSGDAYGQYQYVPDRRSLLNFYAFVGMNALVKTSTERRSAGEMYYLRYDRIHRVLLPLRDMTCTLVLRGPRERQHSNIFNTSYPTRDVGINNTAFSTAELKAKLAALLARLRAGAAVRPAAARAER